MLKILNFSICHKAIQLLVWGFVFMAVISPSSILVAQDDVEEYWGDDEEYDEYEDEDEYLDDDEYAEATFTLELQRIKTEILFI